MLIYIIIAIIVLVVSFIVFNRIGNKAEIEHEDKIHEMKRSLYEPLLEQEKNMKSLNKEKELLIKELTLREQTLTVKVQELEATYTNLMQKAEDKTAEINDLKQVYINPFDLHKYFIQIMVFGRVKFKKSSKGLLERNLKVMYKQELNSNKFEKKTILLMRKLDKDIKTYAKSVKLINETFKYSSYFEIQKMEKKQIIKMLKTYFQGLEIVPNDLERLLTNLIVYNLDEALIIMSELEIIISLLEGNKRRLNIYVADRDMVPEVRETLARLKISKKIIVTIRLDKKLLDGFIIEDQFYKFDNSFLRVIKELELHISKGGGAIEK